MPYIQHCTYLHVCVHICMLMHTCEHVRATRVHAQSRAHGCTLCHRHSHSRIFTHTLEHTHELTLRGEHSDRHRITCAIHYHAHRDGHTRMHTPSHTHSHSHIHVHKESLATCLPRPYCDRCMCLFVSKFLKLGNDFILGVKSEEKPHCPNKLSPSPWGPARYVLPPGRPPSG